MKTSLARETLVGLGVDCAAGDGNCQAESGYGEGCTGNQSLIGGVWIEINSGGTIDCDRDYKPSNNFS